MAKYLDSTVRTVTVRGNCEGITHQPQIDVTKPKPPATFSRYSMCSTSTVVVAYGVANCAAAIRAKRGIRQKIATANGTFVRMAPRKKTKLMRVLVRTVSICALDKLKP